MAEAQNNVEQLQQAEQVADSLAAYQRISYDDAFLAHLQEANPPLLAQFIESQAESVLKQVDAEVAKWEMVVLAREIKAEESTFNGMLRDHGFDPAGCKVEIQGAQVNFTLPCPGKPLLVKSVSLREKTSDEWLLDGVPYTPSVVNEEWGTLEEVLEDARQITEALKKVESKEWISTQENPFSFNPANILSFNTGSGLKVLGWGGLTNTFEAVNLGRMAKRLNERYRALTGKGAAPEAPAAAAPAVADAAVSTDTAPTTLSENAPAVKKPDVAPAAAPAAAPVTLSEGVPTVAKPAAAPASTVAAAPTAGAETVTHAVTSDADFVKYRLADNGWKNYVSEIKDEDTSGKIVVKLPTEKNDPDYIYSRIHHFLGKEGVAEISRPENYTVTVNGHPVEWENETWVNPDTHKRVPVVNGTLIEWEAKEVAVAVAAPSAAEAVPEASVDQIADALHLVRDNAAIVVREQERQRDATENAGKAWFKGREKDYRAEAAVHQANIVRLRAESAETLAFLEAHKTDEAYAQVTAENPTVSLVALNAVLNPSSAPKAVADAKAAVPAPEAAVTPTEAVGTVVTDAKAGKGLESTDA